MKGRGLIVGLLLVIGLAVFAYLEVRRDSVEGVRDEHELVFPYNLRRVAELEIELGERRAHLERDASGSWQVLEGQDIDLEYVGDFVSAWGQMRYLETVSETPSASDLSRFELDPPRLVARARIRTTEGQDEPPRPPILEVGGALPLQMPGYYARLDGFERVVAVSPEAGGMVQGPARQVFGMDSQLVGPEGSQH